MKIIENPDQEIVRLVREGLKRTGGYCPCRREITPENKCMCREFREQIRDPDYEGFCHCMLYYKSRGENRGENRMGDNDAVILETERLRLYPLNEEQLRSVIDAETESEMKAAYGEMLQGCLEHPEQWVWYTIWNMERKSDAETIGDLCFKGLREDGSVEIGYGIKPAFEGCGYTTEAVAALIHWAADQPGVICVEAETEPDNYASQRVLEKNGFVPNGIQGEEGPRFVWKP